MGMDLDSGKIRELSEAIQARDSEVIFRTGEIVSLKGGFFKIVSIMKDQMVLEGISREAGLRAMNTSIKNIIRPTDEANVF